MILRCKVIVAVFALCKKQGTRHPELWKVFWTQPVGYWSGFLASSPKGPISLVVIEKNKLYLSDQLVGGTTSHNCNTQFVTHPAACIIDGLYFHPNPKWGPNTQFCCKWSVNY